MNRSDAFEALRKSPFAYWLPYLRGPVGPPGKDGKHGARGNVGKSASLLVAADSVIRLPSDFLVEGPFVNW